MTRTFEHPHPYPGRLIVVEGIDIDSWQELNESLDIEGVLLTMFDGRLRLSNQIVEEVKKFFGE